MLRHTLSKAVRQPRFWKIFILLISLALLLGLVIVPIETLSGRSDVLIRTPFDGLWWAVTTVTTVGYGDYVPVTVLGRLIGMLLQVIGGLTFGSVVALFSIELNRYQNEYYSKRIMDRLDRLEKTMEELHRHSNYLVRNNEKKAESGEEPPSL